MGMKKTLPQIEFVQNGIVEYIDPNNDLAIVEDDIVEECAKQSAKYAFYGYLANDSAIALEHAKNSLSIFEAEQEQTMRNRIIERYGEKERITEAKLKAEFARDEVWVGLNNNMLNTKMQTGRLEVVKDALKQRSQQLYNICSVRRQEMTTNRGDYDTERQ